MGRTKSLSEKRPDARPASLSKRSAIDLDALISLNISHLHDASNFFALLKNQIENGEDLEQLKRFSKGAAYHFRALFEELKANKELLSSSVDCELNTLYSKEIIDLKDLLDLELLENNRVNLNDQCQDQRALVEANFGLLTKLIVNIVENALKYSTANIDIELQAKANTYQLKIRSYGTNIPENLAADLKSSKGHGLSSSANIIAFHSARVDISSLANEGTSITISFNKTQEQKTKILKNKKPAQISRFSFVSIMAVAIFLSLSCFKASYDDYSIHRIAEHKPRTQVSFKQELQDLNEAYLSNQNTKVKLNQILNKVKNMDLAQYALLTNTAKDENWISEAETILKKIPSAYDLRLALAESYIDQRQYLKAFEAAIISLYYYFIDNNQEHKIAKYTISKRGLEYYLSSDAGIGTSTAENNKSLSHRAREASHKQLNQNLSQRKNQTGETNKDPELGSNQFQELNQLIEEQNQALGLNLEL